MPSAQSHDRLVSIVMPAYNHEQFVSTAIDSILRQTVSDFEFIVIDDGSTDDTLEIVRSYSDPRIVCHTQRNQDAFNALNRGLRLACGEYIAVLNSDDVFEPDRLAVLLEVARRSGAACVFTGVVAIDEAGRVIDDPVHPWNLWYAKVRSHFAASPTLYHGFLKGNALVTTSNLFMTRAAYTEIGDFAPLRFLHDYDYIFRILLRFEDRTVFLSERPLVRYRLHARNTLREAAVLGRLEDQQVIRRYLFARAPAAMHSYLDVGVDRLLELAAELHEVRLTHAEVAR